MTHTKTKARKIDLEATKQRMLKAIEAGEEARGETPPIVSVEDWEQRFDEKFPLNGEVWVLERHRDAVKKHHLKAIDLAKQQERARLRSEIEKLKDYKNGKPWKKPEYDCDCGYSYDDCTCEYNTAISDILALLDKE